MASSSRTGPTRCGGATDRARTACAAPELSARRGGGRSAGDGDGGVGRLRHRRRGARRRRARPMCSTTARAGARAGRLGARGGRGLSAFPGRPRGRRGQPGRRPGRHGAAPDRPPCRCEVRATRGKWLRAEPVAALYAEGRVAHVGEFPGSRIRCALSAPTGSSGGASPDRLDALVWALTDLMLRARPSPESMGVKARLLTRGDRHRVGFAGAG